MKPKLLNNPALKAFFDQATKIKVAQPPPKFEVGDYIINSKFRVISKILEIRGIFENEDRTYNYDGAEYIMQDVKNDARDTFMSGVDRSNGSGASALRHTVERKYKRHKFVRAIDAYYNKISPEAVQALYSNKVSNGDESVND